MARPPFHLTDDQARLIAGGVAGLDARFPLDPRSHRPFVRAFIELVRDVTGNLYSPTIYRRLLGAYAPGRRPSTETLAIERERAAAAAAAPHAATSIDQLHATPIPMPSDLAAQVQEAVTEALGRHLPLMQRSSEQLHAAQVEFYRHQLSQSEEALARVRSQLAQANAELAAMHQGMEQYRAEVEAARSSIVKQAETIDALTRSNDDMRKFALLAIEEARGESRAWKERCAEMELQRQKDGQLLESLRRQVYASSGKPLR